MQPSDAPWSASTKLNDENFSVMKTWKPYGIHFSLRCMHFLDDQLECDGAENCPARHTPYIAILHTTGSATRAEQKVDLKQHGATEQALPRSQC